MYNTAYLVRLLQQDAEWMIDEGFYSVSRRIQAAIELIQRLDSEQRTHESNCDSTRRS